ncbi:MAG TPA: hypothetical protein VEH07_03140 [Alphaproteobacteria bacterium]|nr:hypothetical protein [Alphaproteobacteria bacterium]
MVETSQREVMTSPSAGRGTGIIIGALFGLAWLYNALKFDHKPDWMFHAAYGATALIVLGGVMRIRDDRKSGVRQPGSTRIAFFVVLAIEIAAIVAAVIVLSRWHMQQYIVAALAATVGVHFLPLAKIFHAPIYYVTGLAMVAAAAAAAVSLTGAQQVICIAYSAGAILLLTAFSGVIRR